MGFETSALRWWHVIIGSQSVLKTDRCNSLEGSSPSATVGRGAVRYTTWLEAREGREAQQVRFLLLP